MGEVDEGGATEVEGHEEEVAGQFQGGMGGEVGLFDGLDDGEIDGALAGLVDAGVGGAEGVLLGDDAVGDGTVIDGAEDAHIEGDGVAADASVLEPRLVGLDEGDVEAVDGEVELMAEAHEAVEGGLVVVGGAPLLVDAHLGNEALHGGAQRELFGEAVVLVDDAVGGIVGGGLVERGDNAAQQAVLALDHRVDAGEVDPAGGLGGGGVEEDLLGEGIPLVGVEPIGGHDLAHHAAVNNLKEQYALLASDGRGTKLNLDTCHCFTLFLLSLYNHWDG